MAGRRSVDTRSFKGMVEKGYLPKDRAEGCGEEFHQVAYAVKKLIDPSVDAELRRESRRPTRRAGKRRRSRPRNRRKRRPGEPRKSAQGPMFRVTDVWDTTSKGEDRVFESDHERCSDVSTRHGACSADPSTGRQVRTPQERPRSTPAGYGEGRQLGRGERGRPVHRRSSGDHQPSPGLLQFLLQAAPRPRIRWTRSMYAPAVPVS